MKQALTMRNTARLKFMPRRWPATAEAGPNGADGGIRRERSSIAELGPKLTPRLLGRRLKRRWRGWFCRNRTGSAVGRCGLVFCETAENARYGIPE